MAEENKSTYYTDEDIKLKIDKQLEKMASIETTLGTNSTVSEYKRAKKKQDTCLKKIKELDVTFYNSIVPQNDEE